MRTRIAHLSLGSAVLAMLTVPAFGQSTHGDPHASGPSGSVYVMTNSPSGNAVLQYHRAPTGALTLVAQTSTGGTGGTGNGVGNIDPLGSQDSLVLSEDGARLLAVNAGSNELSSLRSDSSGLTLVSKVASGGAFPNSVARAGRLVYVLNARGTPNVSGFTLHHDGTLAALAGSTRELPGGNAAVPHDIRFSPDGDRLTVTEDGTNQIDVFDLDADGLIGNVTTIPSPGAGPFGVAFGSRGMLIVTEAAAGAASSYRLTPQSLHIVTVSEPNGQMASCWIALTRHGQAFIANTASGTLSSYQAAANGTLNLAQAITANTGSGSAPIDVALSGDDQFLYVLDSALGRALSYRVDGHHLRPIGTVADLPTTVQGIAAQ